MKSEEVIVYLSEYSTASGIPLDVILSLYLVVGQDIFFIFSLFQGMKIKFPKPDKLSKVFSYIYRVFDVTDLKEIFSVDYKMNVDIDELDKDEHIILNGEEQKVYKSCVLFGRTYVITYRK